MIDWQKYARDAAIRALDEGAGRLGDSGERAIHRISREWNALSEDEKRELLEILIAIGTAVGIAVAAFRETGGKKKAKAQKKAKKAGKKVVKKVTKSTVGKKLKKATK